jgi:nucleoside-diphosphate-sugar epimerase
MDSKNPKHLITGSSGFLGKKIIERLVTQGQEVVGIDIQVDPSPISGVEYIVGDVRNSKTVERIIKDISIVYHTAALVPLTKAYSDFRSVNVQGSRVLAKLAKEANVEKFIHISSSAVFGKTADKEITNETQLNPIEPYGISKLKAEIAVKEELKGTNTKLILIRPRTILGAERGGIFDMFFRWIQSNDPVFIMGSGNNKFQFVHVEDLIDAIFLTISKDVSGDFNVGTDSFGTLNEAFSALIKYSNSKSKVRHLPVLPAMAALTFLEKLGLSPLAPWHYKTFHLPFFFDVSNLTQLGWKPRFSNDSMFENSYDSFKKWSSDTQEFTTSPHRSRLESRVLSSIQKLFR